MFDTYVLLSLRDNKLYIGYTSDVERRCAEHNSGKVKSTKNRRPLILVYKESCLHAQDAIKREKYFKTGFGRRFLYNRLEYTLRLAMAGEERQKVVVKKVGKRLIIEDWKK